MKKDYILKIEIPEFPRNRKGLRKIINHLKRWVNEFEKEKDLHIFAKKFTSKLMK